MTKDQRYDLIAEANWEVCVDQFGIISNAFNPYCRHAGSYITGDHDLQRAHYATDSLSAIPVIGVSRYRSQTVYQEMK